MSIFNGVPKKQLLGGYDQNAAMMGQSGFAPMNEGFAPQQHTMQPAAKKPGPNWAGIASDFLAGMAGQPGQFAAQQQHERAMQQRTQQAEQERMTRREDMQWEWQNKPKDTGNPYRWESNDGSLMQIGPDGQPMQLYKDPTPKQQWVSDGYGGGQLVSVAGAPTATGLPEIGAVVSRNKGGGVGNGTATFRPKGY